MVLNYVRQHGRVACLVVTLCRLSPDQAAKLLKRLKERERSFRTVRGSGQATRRQNGAHMDFYELFMNFYEPLWAPGA